MDEGERILAKTVYLIGDFSNAAVHLVEENGRHTAVSNEELAEEMYDVFHRGYLYRLWNAPEQLRPYANFPNMIVIEDDLSGKMVTLDAGYVRFNDVPEP